MKNIAHIFYWINKQIIKQILLNIGNTYSFKKFVMLKNSVNLSMKYFNSLNAHYSVIIAISSLVSEVNS